ncbi:MAG: hypothetical protein K8L99_01860 [Anaerolineae bacterium]|nr:hypothetical protein [Anaerolineae bacterium]
MWQRIQIHLKRIGADLRALRNIDNYVVAALAIILALLGLVGDFVSQELKLSIILAALGLLVYNLTVPAHSTALNADDLLNDRSNFAPLSERIKGARKLWIYAPSAVNILNIENLLAIKDEILMHANGELRVIIQDPEENEAVNLGVKHLDEAMEFPMQDLPKSIDETLSRLAKIPTWNAPGQFAYKFLPYNPGFSMVAIDPDQKHGRVIVEFHGFHHRYMPDRMHIELTPEISERWFKHWVDQFEHMWSAGREP